MKLPWPTRLQLLRRDFERAGRILTVLLFAAGAFAGILWIAWLLFTWIIGEVVV